MNDGLRSIGGLCNLKTGRAYCKGLFNVLATVAVLPLYLYYHLSALFSEKDIAFWSCSQLLSLIPGKAGSFLRKNFFALTMTYCSKDCAIMFGTLFSQVDTEIGKKVYIGPNCNIGRCIIGDFCILGSSVHITSGHRQHHFTHLDIPIQEQGGELEKIRIGEDTWIGNSAVIMAEVGKKCIIGAGSVVTRKVDDYSIVGGNPAALIRKRV